MRPLNDKETTMVFEKLFKFTGPNLKHLLEQPSVEGPDPEPDRYCLRLHKNRTFYASESLFTHGGAFHLTVHTLDLLAAHVRCRIWLKPDTERSFLFEHQVAVMSMADVPLGFGVAARGAQDCRKANTNAVVVLHQSDAGEYLRKEELV
ncbi:hypothetical protein CFC21_083334 [Triticum aestivum]|uniref:60S ribosome subunit biogenesis protein NIP7 homolog n=2 Tax=Triticum aestivum TaxID=4565 RepID=A0A9R1L613_WHEAT|nr:hypothetical protein CFC21_083333 [Triticum aestivum]KAF7079025.1 hypothetical protein CFC21_083334 [Triticum aestivum]